MTSDDTTLRTAALKRIKKKRDFGAHVLAYVLVNALLIGIWAMSSDGFFWPIFPIMGWGIGIAFNAWDVYRGDPTEAEIAREMERIGKRPSGSP